MNDMSPRQLRQLARPCEYGDFHADLASSIVVHALGDWREYAEATDNDIRDEEYHYLLKAFKFDSPRQELLEFLCKDWCCFLVEGLSSVPHDVFLRELGLGLPSQVYAFLQGRITRVQLEDWIVPQSHVLFADPESRASNLAAAVELGLAQISEGLIDEGEFHDQLQHAVQQYTTVTVCCPPTIRDGEDQ